MNTKSIMQLVGFVTFQFRSSPVFRKTANAVSTRVMGSYVAQIGLLALCLGGVSISPAQVAAGGGTITGRILNADTNEFVRNAEVRVQSTDISAISGEEGYYRLTNVPVGEVELAVHYTGYPPATATVTVTAGLPAKQDFEISSARRFDDSDSPVILDKLEVTSHRVGESKAIMQQRNSQDITNVVAAETFGDNASGNIAEFLQNVPGVEISIDRGEATSVRLRGLPSEYTSVTFDGVSFAGADANAATRALNFENFSLDSVESIEVSKTVSADVDANAPAGTINLRPKRAFDLAGRRVVIDMHVNAHSDHFSLKETNGPTDSRTRKVLPSGKVSYSDVVMDGRLGFNLTLSTNQQFSDHMELRQTNNYSPTTADPRTVVPTEIRFAHTPRMDSRDTASSSMDFKATPNLVLSLATIYNTKELITWQREVIFGMGARNTVLGDAAMTNFTTSATNANVRVNPTAIVKRSESISLLPKFEYRWDNLKIDGRFIVSNSKGWYDPYGLEGAARDLLGGSAPQVTGVTYTGTRSSSLSGDWNIVQTGGRDWAAPSNYTTGLVRENDGRSAKTNLYSGDVTATFTTEGPSPVVWKAGVKRQVQDRKFRNDTSAGIYSLNGAPSVGGWADYQSGFDFEYTGAGLNASTASISGGNVWMPDLQGIGALLRNEPSRFTHVLSASSYYTAYMANTRDLEETIDAAFLMATTKWGRATIRLGVRWEDTTTDVLEFDPVSADKTRAAGYTVSSSTGNATTIDGLVYQYFTNPRVHRVGNYDNFFPSGSIKYQFPKGVDLQLGFSSTIRRPEFADQTGVWTVNETALTVTAPNKNLKPEKSRNYSLRLAKYFEPRGVLAVNVFQNNVRGLFLTQRLTAAEFGYEGEENYSAYDFITTTQSSEEVTLRGMEIEYSQGLSFLPGPFGGLSVRGSYTRSYADDLVPLIVPHSFTAGLSYARGKFSAYSNYTWRDTHFLNYSTTALIYRHEGKMDIGGAYRISKGWRIYFRARDILNTPRIVLDQNGTNPRSLYGYFTNGTLWTFGGEYAY